MVSPGGASLRRAVSARRAGRRSRDQHRDGVAHARGSRAAGDDGPGTRSSTLPSREEAQHGRVKAEPAALAAVARSHREGHGGARQLARQDAAPAFIQENATVQRFASSAAEYGTRKVLMPTVGDAAAS